MGSNNFLKRLRSRPATSEACLGRHKKKNRDTQKTSCWWAAVLVCRKRAVCVRAPGDKFNFSGSVSRARAIFSGVGYFSDKHRPCRSSLESQSIALNRCICNGQSLCAARSETKLNPTTGENRT